MEKEFKQFKEDTAIVLAWMMHRMNMQRWPDEEAQFLIFKEAAKRIGIKLKDFS